MSLSAQFQKLLARVMELVNRSWTGQITIEINLTQGALGSIYFTAKERLSTKKKESKHDLDTRIQK